MAATCPPLAEPPPPSFISLDNMNMTLVSTFNRTEGTKVTFTCHVPELYKLQGAPVLTCLENGTWDHPPPSCVLSATTTTLPTPTTSTAHVIDDDDVTMLPYIIGSVLVAAAIIMIAITLMTVLLWKSKRQTKHKYRRYGDSRKRRNRRNKGRNSADSDVYSGNQTYSDIQYPYVREYPYFINYAYPSEYPMRYLAPPAYEEISAI